MSVAEQFARLVLDVNLKPSLNVPVYRMDQRAIGATRTVYSVGEAMRRREQLKDAKLGAGSL